MITDILCNKGKLSKEPELGDNRYSMFNTGGVECEVGDFLYSLVRMLKCTNILETGTHYGISASYMALAMKQNNLGGKLTTIDPTFYDQAKNLFNNLELNDIITQEEIHAENFETDEQYDLILLDSEPKIRFDEFEKFFKNCKEGGLIIIHDINSDLSYGIVNPDHPDYKHWPFGDFRPTLGKYISNFDVQTFSFLTPRGITLFQKRTERMSYTKLIKNEL